MSKDLIETYDILLLFWLAQLVVLIYLGKLFSFLRNAVLEN